jgi:hypothetical protein
MKLALTLTFVAFAAALPASAGLVTNGTFDGGSCASWTASPTPFNTHFFNECSATGGNPGGFAILNDNPAVPVQMSQTIAGLSIGIQYHLTWDMEDVYNCCASGVVPGTGASIDGNLWEFVVPDGQSWQSYSETFTYTGGSNVLVFSAQRNGTDTDAGFDNIQLTALSAPEPSTLPLVVLAGIALFGMRKHRMAHQAQA